MAVAADMFGPLSRLAGRRLLSERRALEAERAELEATGIFVSWGDDLQNAVALIIGPADTPYEGGFYFFDVRFPDNYPLRPPCVELRTGDGRVRFNPNLYVDGRVCLSILGTWPGPAWTCSCNLRTVMLSIQSLLHAHPIQNEPGLETECGTCDKVYSEILQYENIKVAVVRMLRKTPPRFEVFRTQMRVVFLHHFASFLDRLNSYVGMEGRCANFQVFQFYTTFQPTAVANELESLRAMLLQEELEALLDQEEPLSARADIGETENYDPQNGCGVGSKLEVEPIRCFDAGNVLVEFEASLSPPRTACHIPSSITKRRQRGGKAREALRRL